MGQRKPFGVWVLLRSSGRPWFYDREATLAAALLTARTLREDWTPRPRSDPNGRPWPVWIAAPPERGARRPVFRTPSARAFVRLRPRESDDE